MLLHFPDLIRKYNIHPEGVIHCGSNIGQEAAWYYENDVWTTLWIEADPNLMYELNDNIKKYPNMTSICACISDVDNEEVEFHISNNGGQSSSVLELGTHRQAHPEVDYVETIKQITWRMDTLLKTFRIDTSLYDFLNIDVQGYELKVLKGFGDLLSKFKYIYVEVNQAELYAGCPMKQEIYDYCDKFGFQLKEELMTNFGWGDSFLCK